MGSFHAQTDYIQITDTQPAGDSTAEVSPGAAVGAGAVEIIGNKKIPVTPGYAESDGGSMYAVGDADIQLAESACEANATISADVYAGVVTLSHTPAETDSTGMDPMIVITVSPGAAETAGGSIDISGYTIIIVVVPAAAEMDAAATVKPFVNDPPLVLKTGMSIVLSNDGALTDSPEIYAAISVELIASYVNTDSPDMSPTTFYIDFSETLTLFLFTLTGAADGLADVEIPITSFQMRLYADKSAYLQVTIPGIEYVDEIAARSQGSLILYMAYASVGDLTILQKEQIIAVAMEAMNVDEGTVKSSITLSGHETDAQAAARQAAPKSITLGDSWYNYKRTTGGSVTARMVRPHIYLQAGDTITDDDGSFEVDRITWMKSESVHHMEITGAET